MPGSPEPGRPLDRETLTRAFDGLEKQLASRGVRAHVYIVGSAVLLMAHRRSRITMDVDALSIDHRDVVLDCARVVAKEQELRDDWLNDQVRWIPILPPHPDPRAEVLHDSPHLVVTGASAPHILAMKVRAARTSDLEDIKLLMRQLGITTMEEVREIHRAVYPLDGIPWRNEERIEGCLRDLREEGETPDGSLPRSTGDPGHRR